MIGRRVLVVAEPGPGRDLLCRLVGEASCAVVAADGAADAVRRADDEWDAVLVDVGLASDDGFRVTRTLRTKLGADVPIVLLTALGDLETRRRGLEHGADDFLVMPPTALEVGVRLSQALRLRELSRELVAARDALALSAIGDPVTGLFSAGALIDRLAAEYARARRYRRPLAVLAIAVELAGPGGGDDRRLAGLGQAVRATLRQTDFLARVGPAELAVVAPETDEPAASELVQRLSDGVAAIARQVRARFAIGTCTIDDRQVATAVDLLDRARARLGRAR